MADYILGITGASGTILAKKALRWLTQLGHHVHLVPSKAALYTATIELNISTAKQLIDDLPDPCHDLVTIHRNADIGASIASGSFQTAGMLIAPCSMATLAAISVGLGDNLIRRAADVMIKENRRLVLVPRETPLNAIHLENMLKLSRLGVTILPPMPAWYSEPTSLDEMENAIVARMLELLGVENVSYKRWCGGTAPTPLAKGLPFANP